MVEFLNARHALREMKFSILLVYELFFIFLYPFVQTTFYEWLLHVSTVFILVVVKQLACKRPIFKFINLMLLMLMIGIFSVDYTLYFTDILIPVNQDFFRYIYDLFFVVYFFYTAAVLLIELLTEEEPISDTLSGAASLFILLGFAWAYVYMTIADFNPNAFHLIRQPGTNDFLNFLFFSISRLVSMDFNHKVEAVSSLAISLSLLQAIMGALYTAIITGEIVGLHLAKRSIK